MLLGATHLFNLDKYLGSGAVGPSIIYLEVVALYGPLGPYKSYIVALYGPVGPYN